MFCVFKTTLFLIITNIIFITLVVVIPTLSFVLIGGSMPMAERKILAVIQRRTGPSVVGYKGRAQFIADALKLLVKEPIYITNVNKLVLVLLPTMFLLLNIATPFMLVWGNNKSFINVEYDIITIIIVMVLSNIIIIYTGLLLKNKYTQLSSSRAATVSLNMEITLSFLINYIVMYLGSFSTNGLMILKQFLVPTLAFIPIIVPLVLVILMDLGKAPFDLVEAETELIMGFHSDYSGFLFVIFLLGEYLHVAIVGYLIAILLL